MAQNWVPKQVNWIQRFSGNVVALMQIADQLTELCNEFADNQYGTGGANAITDAVVQTGSGNFSLPAATALTVAEAEGVCAGTNQILAVIATNRGYLENMRP